MMLDRYKATILGLACGDALGAPTEFMCMDRIRKTYGPGGIQDIEQTSGQYTDDTQMTIALGEGLLDSYEFYESVFADKDEEKQRAGRETLLRVPEQVMPYVAKRFAEWSVSPENTRAPGTTCMAGCRALVAGKSWRESGVLTSKGCGSAMRASPVGLIHPEGRVLGQMARASSVITHGHQVAQDAAHVAALAVRLLLDGKPVDDLVPALIEIVVDEEFAALLESVEQAVELTINGALNPDEAMIRGNLGEAWEGDSAVASALYCFLLAHERSQGYVETVRYGANTCGDSDSIACIGGSFAGALWGLDGEKGVPDSWVNRVENRDELILLAQRLYGLHLELR
jgi:ADP-ribosylglycohydrolase